MRTFIHNNPFVSLLITLVCLFLYQCLNIFWGVDVVDSGWYLVCYENILGKHDCMLYSFMYYLTNLIGGISLLLFPDMGIAGFRIMGALCILLVCALIFIFLKDEIPVMHLLLGITLVVICYLSMPYMFNNGILSCFLYTIAILLLYKGLKYDNSWFLILSGILVGINIFSRIPNVLGVGLCLVALFHKKLIKNSEKCAYKPCLFMGGGIVFGIVLILFLMYHLGHLSNFLESINAAVVMGNSPSSSHPFTRLISAQLWFFINNLILFFIFLGLFVAQERINGFNSIYLKVFWWVFSLLWLFYYIYNNHPTTIYRILWVMCVVGCLLAIYRQRAKMGLLSILALYMLFVEVMGSNYANCHGSLPALLAAPISSSQILRLRRSPFVVVFIFSALFILINKGNFLDYGPIGEKKAVINCEEAKYVLTTEEKAAAINTTLVGIKPYVSQGDRLICFPNAIMLNYLTHTLPVNGVSFPDNESNSFFPIEGTPCVLFNKFNPYGSNWKEDFFNIDTKYNFDIKSFLVKNHYKKVYENDYFILFDNRVN